MSDSLKNTTNINNFFLLSDQCIIQLSDENKFIYWRATCEGFHVQVNEYGNPISFDKVVLETNIKGNPLIFPPLTFYKQIYGGRLVSFKKAFILKILKNIFNITKIKKIKNLDLVDFELFMEVFLGDLLSVLKYATNTGLNLSIYKTSFFEIKIDFNINQPANNEKHFFLSYLELQYLLEKLYPAANVKQIGDMRLLLVDALKNIGFDFYVSQRRISLLTLPSEFRMKIISTNQYTVQDNSIRSYVFYGIRFLHPLF